MRCARDSGGRGRVESCKWELEEGACCADSGRGGPGVVGGDSDVAWKELEGRLMGWPS